MRSTNRGMDPPDRKKVPPRPSVGIFLYSIISRGIFQRLSFHSLNNCTVCGCCLYRPWATCTFRYHWSYTSYSTETLQQPSDSLRIWCHRPGWSIANLRATVAAWLCQAPRFSDMPHYSLLVYSTIIRLQLNPAQDSLSWVRSTTPFVIVTNSTFYLFVYLQSVNPV